MDKNNRDKIESNSKSGETYKSKVKVSILIPGIVDTGIVDSNRNRPKELKNPSKGSRNWDEINKRLEAIRDRYRGSMTSETVADITFEAIKNEVFYIYTEMGMKNAVETRYQWMINDFKALDQYLKKNNQNS